MPFKGLPSAADFPGKDAHSPPSLSRRLAGRMGKPFAQGRRLEARSLHRDRAGKGTGSRPTPAERRGGPLGEQGDGRRGPPEGREQPGGPGAGTCHGYAEGKKARAVMKAAAAGRGAASSTATAAEGRGAAGSIGFVGVPEDVAKGGVYRSSVLTPPSARPRWRRSSPERSFRHLARRQVSARGEHPQASQPSRPREGPSGGHSRRRRRRWR